jgi:hypothetical protein
MNVKEVIKSLKKSKDFIQWKSKNKKSYLSHLFMLIEKSKPSVWEIGFFNPENNSITVFEIHSEKITARDPEEAFKQEHTKILEVDETKIKSSLEEILETCEELRTNKYKLLPSLKVIVVLQKLDIGQVWNITLLTQSFKILNVKIDTETKKIIDDKTVSIIEHVDNKE